MRTPKKPKQSQPDSFKTFLLRSQLNNLQGENLLEPIYEESNGQVSENQICKNLTLGNGL